MTAWRTIRDSEGFHGLPNVMQEAADVHCERYGHSPAVMDPVVIGTVARCTACGRSIALLEAAHG